MQMKIPKSIGAQDFQGPYMELLCCAVCTHVISEVIANAKLHLILYVYR